MRQSHKNPVDMTHRWEKPFLVGVGLLILLGAGLALMLHFHAAAESNPKSAEAGQWPEGLPAPNEFAPFPACSGGPLGADGKPNLQPYAWNPRVYGGIYLAVEQEFASRAKYFFPVLQVEDGKNWVRITRTTRNGAKPPDHLTIDGDNFNLRGSAGSVPVILKIDKCTGGVLEMDFDRDKVR